MSKRKVLILCTGNSARSQMAEGLFRTAGGEAYEVHSAGTRPSLVREEAIAVMGELGIDLSGQRSKSVDEFAGVPLDLVITVCDQANEICPVYPGMTTRLHWPFEDPAGVEGTREEREAAFRKVREQIRARIGDYLAGQT